MIFEVLNFESDFWESRKKSFPLLEAFCFKWNVKEFIYNLIYISSEIREGNWIHRLKWRKNARLFPDWSKTICSNLHKPLIFLKSAPVCVKKNWASVNHYHLTTCRVFFIIQKLKFNSHMFFIFRKNISHFFGPTEMWTSGFNNGCMSIVNI